MCVCIYGMLSHDNNGCSPLAQLIIWYEGHMVFNIHFNYLQLVGDGVIMFVIFLALAYIFCPLLAVVLCFSCVRLRNVPFVMNGDM